MSDSAIHARYIELVRIAPGELMCTAYKTRPQYQQIRRNERDHARERQKLTKDKDTGKLWFSALTCSFSDS